MASHRLKFPFRNYGLRDLWKFVTLENVVQIGSLGNKILVPEPESSPCCAKCGTPVDGPYCRGCALLRKNFKEDLLTYCGENETSKDFKDISESSDDNTNVVNAPRRSHSLSIKTPVKCLRKDLYLLTKIVVTSAVIH
ncbi:hypothetical protein Tco_1395935 [Tanacetum coccineum]